MYLKIKAGVNILSLNAAILFSVVIAGTSASLGWAQSPNFYPNNDARSLGGTSRAPSIPSRSQGGDDLEIQVSNAKLLAALKELDSVLKVTWKGITAERFWMSFSRFLGQDLPAINSPFATAEFKLVAALCQRSAAVCGTLETIAASGSQWWWGFRIYRALTDGVALKDAEGSLSATLRTKKLTGLENLLFKIIFTCSNSAVKQPRSPGAMLGPIVSFFDLFYSAGDSKSRGYNCVASVTAEDSGLPPTR